MIKSDDLKFGVIKTAVLYFIFLFFTVLAKFFQVKEYTAGTLHKIGFGNLNLKFQRFITTNPLTSKMSDGLIVITDILAYAAIAVMIAFAFLGLYQLIRFKSFKKVDYTIYCLAITYVILLLSYAIFELIIINYRPVLIDNQYEASYPSSHTMLAIVVFSTTINQITRTFKYKKNLNKLLCTLCVIAIAVSVIGRLFCGIHWFTDIVGAILISMAIIETYNTLVLICDYRHQTIKLRFEDDDVITDEASEPAEIDII